MKSILIISLLVVAINAQSTPILPGGRVDVDVNSDSVKEAANFAYILISNSINSVYSHKMGKVIKAQSQVVSGIKYYLTLEVSETNCKKLDNKEPNACDVTKTEVCEAVVLSRPWDELHKTQLLSYQCQSN